MRTNRTAFNQLSIMVGMGLIMLLGSWGCDDMIVEADPTDSASGSRSTESTNRGTGTITTETMGTEDSASDSATDTDTGTDPVLPVQRGIKFTIHNETNEPRYLFGSYGHEQLIDVLDENGNSMDLFVPSCSMSCDEEETEQYCGAVCDIAFGAVTVEAGGAIQIAWDGNMLNWGTTRCADIPDWPCYYRTPFPVGTYKARVTSYAAYECPNASGCVSLEEFNLIVNTIPSGEGIISEAGFSVVTDEDVTISITQ